MSHFLGGFQAKHSTEVTVFADRPKRICSEQATEGEISTEQPSSKRVKLDTKAPGQLSKTGAASGSPTIKSSPSRKAPGTYIVSQQQRSPSAKSRRC